MFGFVYVLYTFVLQKFVTYISETRLAPSSHCFFGRAWHQMTKNAFFGPRLAVLLSTVIEIFLVEARIDGETA